MTAQIELRRRAGSFTVHFEGMPPRPLYLLVHGEDGKVISESTLPSGSSGTAKLAAPATTGAVWAEVLDQRGGQVARCELTRGVRARFFGSSRPRRRRSPF